MGKSALVCGAGGFIGRPLVWRLNEELCSGLAQPLVAGLENTYGWIEQQARRNHRDAA